MEHVKMPFFVWITLIGSLWIASVADQDALLTAESSSAFGTQDANISYPSNYSNMCDCRVDVKDKCVVFSCSVPWKGPGFLKCLRDQFSLATSVIGPLPGNLQKLTSTFKNSSICSLASTAPPSETKWFVATCVEFVVILVLSGCLVWQNWTKLTNRFEPKLAVPSTSAHEVAPTPPRTSFRHPPPLPEAIYSVDPSNGSIRRLPVAAYTEIGEKTAPPENKVNIYERVQN